MVGGGRQGRVGAVSGRREIPCIKGPRGLRQNNREKKHQSIKETTGEMSTKLKKSKKKNRTASSDTLGERKKVGIKKKQSTKLEKRKEEGFTGGQPDSSSAPEGEKKGGTP